jgi:hypothetical protein
MYGGVRRFFFLAAPRPANALSPSPRPTHSPTNFDFDFLFGVFRGHFWGGIGIGCFSGMGSQQI